MIAATKLKLNDDKKSRQMSIQCVFKIRAWDRETVKKTLSWKVGK